MSESNRDSGAAGGSAGAAFLIGAALILVAVALGPGAAALVLLGGLAGLAVRFGVQQALPYLPALRRRLIAFLSEGEG